MGVWQKKRTRSGFGAASPSSAFREKLEREAQSVLSGSGRRCERQNPGRPTRGSLVLSTNTKGIAFWDRCAAPVGDSLSRGNHTFQRQRKTAFLTLCWPWQLQPAFWEQLKGAKHKGSFQHLICNSFLPFMPFMLQLLGWTAGRTS